MQRTFRVIEEISWLHVVIFGYILLLFIAAAWATAAFAGEEVVNLTDLQEESSYGDTAGDIEGPLLDDELQAFFVPYGDVGITEAQRDESCADARACSH